MKPHILLILSILATCSCNLSLVPLYRQLQSKPVILSYDYCFINGQATIPQFHNSKTPILVYYFDSTDCAPCNIMAVSRYQPLYAESVENREFQLLALFCPEKKDLQVAIAAAMYEESDIPIAIDTASRFEKINTHIPKDKRFHTFLLDSLGNVLFVGDPLSGESAAELFNKALSNPTIQ